MGANGITLRVKGKNPAEVRVELEDRIEQSRFEDGHSYSGEIGMVTGITFRGSMEDPQKAQDHALELAEKWGAAVVIRVGQTDEWVVGAWCSS